MPIGEHSQNRVELLQRPLGLRILQTLLWMPQHGHGNSQGVQLNYGESLRADTDSLRPALHRVKNDESIAADWKLSENNNNQRIKVCRPTAAGRKQLSAERLPWSQFPQVIAGILNSAAKENAA